MKTTTHKATVPVNAPVHCNTLGTITNPQAVAPTPGETDPTEPQKARRAARKGRRWARRGHRPACVGEVAAACVAAPPVAAGASSHGSTVCAPTCEAPTNSDPANNGHTFAPVALQACGALPVGSSDAPPAPAWLRALPTASALRLKGSRELRNTRALQRLPLMGRTLVRLLRDIDATLQVVAAFGGTTLHIPAERSARALARHPLRAYLTLQQMRRMVQYFAGTDVYIPRCFQAVVRVRDVSIVQRFDQGIRTGASAASVVRELARDYRLSDRWIWTILKKTEM